MENNTPLDYAQNMGKALSAWRDENKEKRAVFLLSMAEEKDDPDERSRAVGVYIDGTGEQLANILCAAFENNADFRQYLEAAVKMHLGHKKG